MKEIIKCKLSSISASSILSKEERGAIAWSERGLLAFSAEGCVTKREEHDGKGIQWPIYCCHINHLQQVFVIPTQHNSPIAYLEWSQSTSATEGSSYLLSCDIGGGLELWEMQSSISEWKCLQRFNEFRGSSRPVCLKWFSLDPSDCLYRLSSFLGKPSPPSPASSPNSSISVPIGSTLAPPLSSSLLSDPSLAFFEKEKEEEKKIQGKKRIDTVLEKMNRDTLSQGSVISFAVMFGSGLLVIFTKYSHRSEWRFLTTKLTLQPVSTADILHHESSSSGPFIMEKGIRKSERWRGLSVALSHVGESSLFVYSLEIGSRKGVVKLIRSDRIFCSPPPLFSNLSVKGVKMATDSNRLILFVTTECDKKEQDGRGEKQSVLFKWVELPQSLDIMNSGEKRKRNPFSDPQKKEGRFIQFPHYYSLSCEKLDVKMTRTALLLITESNAVLLSQFYLSHIHTYNTKRIISGVSSPNSCCLAFITGDSVNQRKEYFLSIEALYPIFLLKEKDNEEIKVDRLLQTQSLLSVEIGWGPLWSLEQCRSITSIFSLAQTVAKELSQGHHPLFHLDLVFYVHTIADAILSSKVKPFWKREALRPLLNQSFILTPLAQCQAEFYGRVFIELNSPLSLSSPSLSSLSSPTFRAIGLMTEYLKGGEGSYVNHQVKEMGEYLEKTFRSALFSEPEPIDPSSLFGCLEKILSLHRERGKEKEKEREDEKGKEGPSPSSLSSEFQSGLVKLAEEQLKPELRLIVPLPDHFCLLFSLSDIALDLCSFFLKSIAYFVEQGKRSTPSQPLIPIPLLEKDDSGESKIVSRLRQLSSSPSPLSSSLSYIAGVVRSYSLLYENLLDLSPCVSLLFDLGFLLQLRRLITFSYVCRAHAGSARTSFAELLKEERGGYNQRHIARMHSLISQTICIVSRCLHSQIHFFENPSLFPSSSSHSSFPSSSLSPSSHITPSFSSPPMVSSYPSSSTPSFLFSHNTPLQEFQSLLSHTREELSPLFSPPDLLSSFPSRDLDLMSAMRLIYLLPCPKTSPLCVDLGGLMKVSLNSDKNEIGTFREKVNSLTKENPSPHLVISSIAKNSSLSSLPKETNGPFRPPFLDCITWTPLNPPKSQESQHCFLACCRCERLKLHYKNKRITTLDDIFKDPRQTNFSFLWDSSCPYCGGVWRPS